MEIIKSLKDTIDKVSLNITSKYGKNEQTLLNYTDYRQEFNINISNLEYISFGEKMVSAINSLLCKRSCKTKVFTAPIILYILFFIKGDFNGCTCTVGFFDFTMHVDGGVVHCEGEKQIHKSNVLPAYFQYDCTFSDGYVYNDFNRF